MKKMLSRAALAAALTLGLVAGANAGSTSGTLTVNATVVNACRIGAVGAITFASYDPANGNASASSAAQSATTLFCTKGDVVAVTLDQGANAASGSTCAAPARQMINGTNKLAYGLYSDNGYSTIWGCVAADQVSFTSTSGTTAKSLSVYATIPGGQDVPAGTYNDTVTLGLTF